MMLSCGPSGAGGPNATRRNCPRPHATTTTGTSSTTPSSTANAPNEPGTTFPTSGFGRAADLAFTARTRATTLGGSTPRAEVLRGRHVRDAVAQPEAGGGRPRAAEHRPDLRRVPRRPQLLRGRPRGDGEDPRGGPGGGRHRPRQPRFPQPCTADAGRPDQDPAVRRLRVRAADGGEHVSDRPVFRQGPHGGLHRQRPRGPRARPGAARGERLL